MTWNKFIVAFFFSEGFRAKQQKTPKKKKSIQCYRALSDNYMENKMFVSKNDRQDESLTGQVRDQAGHCPLTGCYFQPWVCANVMQNSGLVNFVPESRLPCICLNKSIPFTAKRARKSGKYWYQSWLWRNMEHEFPFGTFHQEKQDCLFRRSLAPGNFPLKRPEKTCSNYFQTKFFRNFL